MSMEGTILARGQSTDLPTYGWLDFARGVLGTHVLIHYYSNLGVSPSFHLIIDWPTNWTDQR
jgi:hypothetical protein